jgi:hypothetical protein
VTLALHKPDGSQITAPPILVPARKSILECLHGQPWLGSFTQVDEPFAMVVTAGRPVVPEMCGADNANVAWLQSYHLFNPGSAPAQVTLTFLGQRGGSGPVKLTLDLGPGAVALADSSEVDGLPTSEPFVVRADSSVPICAQMFLRTFTRGLSAPRAMTSFKGVPMSLAG